MVHVQNNALLLYILQLHPLIAFAILYSSVEGLSCYSVSTGWAKMLLLDLFDNKSCRLQRWLQHLGSSCSDWAVLMGHLLNPLLVFMNEGVTPKILLLFFPRRRLFQPWPVSWWEEACWLQWTVLLLDCERREEKLLVVMTELVGLKITTSLKNIFCVLLVLAINPMHVVLPERSVITERRLWRLVISWGGLMEPCGVWLKVLQ